MFSGGSEWMVIALLALLLFGGSQIPKLARSLGRAKKDFQDGLKDGESGDDDKDGKDGNEKKYDESSDGQKKA